MEQLVNEQPTKERLVRRRTIKECALYIKSLDNDTSVTENSIRDLCKMDLVEYYKIGNKVLVDLDDVIAYINRPHVNKKQVRCEVCL